MCDLRESIKSVAGSFLIVIYIHGLAQATNHGLCDDAQGLFAWVNPGETLRINDDDLCYEQIVINGGNLIVDRGKVNSIFDNRELRFELPILPVETNIKIRGGLVGELYSNGNDTISISGGSVNELLLGQFVNNVHIFGGEVGRVTLFDSPVYLYEHLGADLGSHIEVYGNARVGELRSHPFRRDSVSVDIDIHGGSVGHLDLRSDDVDRLRLSYGTIELLDVIESSIVEVSGGRINDFSYSSDAGLAISGGDIDKMRVSRSGPVSITGGNIGLQVVRGTNVNLIDGRVSGTDTLTITDGGQINVVRGTVNLGTPPSNTLNPGDVYLGDNSELIIGTGFTDRGIELLQLAGDFEMSNSSVLSVRPVPGLDSAQVQPLIMIDQQARLNGTIEAEIRVQRTPNQNLNVGDRITIITFHDLEGRFSSADVIDSVDGTFGDDIFYVPNYNSNNVELFTHELPRDVRNRSLPEDRFGRNLLLITHGTNADADGWVHDIAIKAAQHISSDWSVATLDWAPFAGGSEDPQTGPFNPFESARNAINIGEALGMVLDRSNSSSPFENIHLIGHSSGSWLVDALADQLRKEMPNVSIHLTVLDAFVPGFLITKAGTDDPILLGDTADWAEHIVDRRPLFGTNESLAQMFTIDVTDIDEDSSLNPIDWHAWPYEWYLESTKLPQIWADIVDHEWSLPPLFFPGSHEWSGQLLTHNGKFERGNRVKLEFDKDPIFTRPATWRDKLEPSFLAYQATLSGLVDFPRTDRVRIGTNSPVMITFFLDITEPTNVLRFAFEFITNAEGLMSVFFDDELLLEIDESALPDMLFGSGTIFLGNELYDGIHTLAFLLDNPTGPQSIVEISDIQLGHAPTIPEPKTLGILLMILVLSLKQRLRFI